MQVCRNAWPCACLGKAQPTALPEGLQPWDLPGEQSREQRGNWDENDDSVLKTVPERGG